MWAAAFEPVGALKRKAGFVLTLGQMKNGGILFPNALMALQTVMVCPRSAEDTCPTCLRVFGVTTFGHF